MEKPRVFIGSSAEELSVAEAIAENLKHDCYCDIWSQGLFRPSTTTLDSLLMDLGKFDFAIFVFSANDVTNIKIGRASCRERV